MGNREMVLCGKRSIKRTPEKPIFWRTDNNQIHHFFFGVRTSIKYWITVALIPV